MLMPVQVKDDSACAGLTVLYLPPSGTGFVLKPACLCCGFEPAYRIQKNPVERCTQAWKPMKIKFIIVL